MEKSYNLFHGHRNELSVGIMEGEGFHGGRLKGDKKWHNCKTINTKTY